MSYDLIVYRTPSGRDPEDVFEEEMEAEEAGVSHEPIQDQGLDRCRAMIEQLAGDRVVCNLCGRHLNIDIPYHYEGAEAQQLMREIAQCLERACREDGLTVYDPQVGRALSPQRDLAVMLRSHERGTGIVRDVQRLQAELATSRPPKQGDSYTFTVEERKP